jgi:hypothetical protein
MNWQDQTRAKSDCPRERANEKRYTKGKREGSRHRAERVAIASELTTEEARNTEVGITKTGRGRYGNAHIRYDINDGLVDILLEVTPTEEQKAERIKEQKEQESKRRMAKEKEIYLHQKEHPHPGPSRSRATHSTGLWRDQLESTWFFTYWEAGDKSHTRQLHPD